MTCIPSTVLAQNALGQVLEMFIEKELNKSTGVSAGEPGSLDLVIRDGGINIGVTPEPPIEVLGTHPRRAVLQQNHPTSVLISPRPSRGPKSLRYMRLSPLNLPQQLSDRGVQRVVIATCGNGLLGFRSCRETFDEVSLYAFGCAELALVDLNDYRNVPIDVLQRTPMRPQAARLMLFSRNAQGRLREHQVPRSPDRQKVHSVLQCY